MDYYEQQAQLMQNRPGGSIADVKFIETWVERARDKDRYHVTSWVADRRQQNQAKAAEVLQRIDKLQDEFVRVRKQAERNEVSWGDLAKLQRRLVNDRITLEKVLESLSASEVSSKKMEDDPTGYLTGFYSRFPALNDRRPNLALDLAEDQRKRGVASLL